MKNIFAESVVVVVTEHTAGDALTQSNKTSI
jgi:hypothetical protein